MSTILGFVAVVCAATNVTAGFLITDRMLAMFKGQLKPEAKTPEAGAQQVNELGSRELIIQASYLAASVLFILGLRSLTRPTQARLGMQQAAMGMLFAVIGTLLNANILTFQWIIIGLVVGAIIGYPMAMKMPMTAMPQFIAFSHAFGAIAATLVGVVEYRVRSAGVATKDSRMGSRRRSDSRCCSAR